jgi:excisionase family DNA binding protein
VGSATGLDPTGSVGTVGFSTLWRVSSTQFCTDLPGLVVIAMRDPEQRDRWLTVGEASRVLGLSRTTLIGAEDSGHLHPIRTPGGHRRYRGDDLQRYLEWAGVTARGVTVVDNASSDGTAKSGVPAKTMRSKFR